MPKSYMISSDALTNRPADVFLTPLRIRDLLTSSLPSNNLTYQMSTMAFHMERHIPKWP